MGYQRKSTWDEKANFLYSEGGMCLDPGSYQFVIMDSYGDGICCSYGHGVYTLYVGEHEIASGGEFANSESETFSVPAAQTRAFATKADTKDEFEVDPEEAYATEAHAEEAFATEVDADEAFEVYSNEASAAEVDSEEAFATEVQSDPRLDE